MTDFEFQAKVILLKRLAWLALVGATLFGIVAATSSDPSEPGTLQVASLGVGVLCVVPAAVYLILLTIWHWKGRYRGTHSNLWGGLLIMEASGWFKLVYLFRHIIPDAQHTGRYAQKAD